MQNRSLSLSLGDESQIIHRQYLPMLVVCHGRGQPRLTTPRVAHYDTDRISHRNRGFAGPLDLLLYLVRKTEIDVCELSLAKITNDFLAYIKVLEFLDFDLIGDFVVVASTLLEIKSREVLPTQIQVVDAPEEEDSGSDLITRLMAYRRYKEASTRLDERAQNGWNVIHDSVAIAQRPNATARTIASAESNSGT